MVTVTPYIPAQITVHLGPPTASAANVTVSFADYVKNVASSEIYPTWEDSALVANILAIISFALNRVYTEFYRSRGYDFDITSSTAIDQKFINGRNIFENVGRLVDELFNTYLRRQGFVEPLAAKFCNGTTVTCDGLSQWGSQELAQQGLSSVEILRRYYGEDIEIVRNAPMRGYAPSYGGTPLRRGSRGPQVVQLQVMLNRIGQNYPAIPRVASVDGIFGTQTENAVLAAQRIFNLDPDGIVGKGTWYQLVRLYVAVTELSELASQGQTFYAVNWQYSRVLREGSTGEPVRVLQYMLQVIGSYINDVPMPPQTGIFGELTANSVRAFQRFSGLAIDGIVGEQTWNAIFDRLAGIAETGPLPQDVTQEIAEEVGYLVQAGVIPNFPGQILRLGDSDTSKEESHANAHPFPAVHAAPAAAPCREAHNRRARRHFRPGDGPCRAGISTAERPARHRSGRPYDLERRCGCRARGAHPPWPGRAAAPAFSADADHLPRRAEHAPVPCSGHAAGPAALL